MKKNIQIIKSTGGFSLIEAVVYSFALIIVISVITAFTIWAISIGSKIKINYALANNGQRAMEIMSYEIKRSRSIYSPTSVFDANPGQLSLEQTATSTPDEFTFIDFFKCGDSLCEKTENNGPIAITNDQVKLTSLTFSLLQNYSVVPSVQINIRLEPMASSTKPEYQGALDLTTTVNLRSF